MNLNHEAVLSLLPKRPRNAHKGDFGKILLLCGSRGFTGAAYLAAMGALRSGAGLVFLGVPESIYAIEAIKLNEAIVFPLPDQNGMLSNDAIPEIVKKLPGMDAVLIGCGLGLSEDTEAVLEAVLNHADCPAVVDADGITLLSKHMDLLHGRQQPTILTPHDGEYRRIGGIPEVNRQNHAEEFAAENNCILLLKGHRTIITDGCSTYINGTGNPGMAVGGSGDLLAGIIVSLLGQRLEPLDAAACGAWLHGAAGDVCAKAMGEYGMLPTDMLKTLPRLMK